ncbi:uncharacterized protein LOC130622777 [Hydractinia symbiolongicarpus]|uniref:uncharacterized protein LOC130622777 n=1 Tax=Hydractinia symbiolongicarpus TaxID=13093 RepID=UPI0025504BC6|nr:uncharacterized protein LOC130622777 [Hydractinia symbiolongicarpus]
MLQDSMLILNIEMENRAVKINNQEEERLYLKMNAYETQKKYFEKEMQSQQRTLMSKLTQKLKFTQLQQRKSAYKVPTSEIDEPIRMEATQRRRSEIIVKPPIFMKARRHSETLGSNTTSSLLNKRNYLKPLLTKSLQTERIEAFSNVLNCFPESSVMSADNSPASVQRSLCPKNVVLSAGNSPLMPRTDSLAQQESHSALCLNVKSPSKENNRARLHREWFSSNDNLIMEQRKRDVCYGKRDSFVLPAIAIQEYTGQVSLISKKTNRRESAIIEEFDDKEIEDKE